jgi:hypothetical protein
MTGDAGPGNVFQYELASSGAAIARGVVGNEGTPIGIDVDAVGAVVYTTGGTTSAQVCLHRIALDGTLAASEACLATCSNPLELFVGPTTIAVACAGDLAIHALDASRRPGPRLPAPAGIALRCAARTATGLIVATAADELARVDLEGGAISGRAPIRAGTLALAIAWDARHVYAGDASGVTVYDASDFRVVASSQSGLGESPVSLVAGPVR